MLPYNIGYADRTHYGYAVGLRGRAGVNVFSRRGEEAGGRRRIAHLTATRIRYLRIRLHCANYWRNPVFGTPPARPRSRLRATRAECVSPVAHRVGHLPESPIDSIGGNYSRTFGLSLFPPLFFSPVSLSSTDDPSRLSCIAGSFRGCFVVR